MSGSMEYSEEDSSRPSAKQKRADTQQPLESLNHTGKTAFHSEGLVYTRATFYNIFIVIYHVVLLAL